MDNALPLVFVGFIAVAIGAVVLSYLAKKKRREGFALVATQLGMEYWPQDPFGLLSEPFALFQKGDGRGIENVLAGAYQAHRLEGVRLLVLRGVDGLQGEHEQDVLPVRLRDRADRCRVLAAHHRQREPLHAAGRCAQLPRHRVRVRGLQPGVQREVAGQEVRERLRRRADDAVAPAERRRAPRSRSWATGCSRYRRKLRPMEIVTLLGISKAFLDHVPRVVYSLYARAAPLPPEAGSDVEAANEAKWLAGHWTPPRAGTTPRRRGPG